MKRKKQVPGYELSDIKVGDKVKDKLDDRFIGIVKNIDDIHNVVVHFYKGKKWVGTGLYCFDKNCPKEYSGNEIIIMD